MAADKVAVGKLTDQLARRGADKKLTVHGFDPCTVSNALQIQDILQRKAAQSALLLNDNEWLRVRKLQRRSRLFQRRGQIFLHIRF